MEIFVISFFVFVLVSAALAIGLFVGRGPIDGGCQSNSGGSCAEKGNCGLRCAKRRKQ
jgi:hypothetical protein